MTTIYGIKNCGTMKKAMQWLEDNKIDFTFYDYKKTAADEALIKKWLKLVGWEELVNRKGMTWRKLPQDVRDNINEKKAVELMLENNSLIKRPVLDTGKQLQLGFKAEEYEELFK